MIDLSWLPDDGGTGHMPPSQEILNFWKRTKEETNFKCVFEIGFNAGHSSSILLSLFDDVRVNSHDIGQFDITLKNGKIVKDKFNERFHLKIIDSTMIKSDDLKGNDLMFIDGGHDYEIVKSDINLFLNSDLKYAVIDDLQHKGVKKAYSEVSQKLIEIHRTTYIAVLPSWMRDDPSKKPVLVPVILAKKK